MAGGAGRGRGPAALRAGGGAPGATLRAGAAIRRRCGLGAARPERRRTALAEAATSGGPARGGTDQRRRRRGPGRGGSPGRGGTTGPGRSRDAGAGAATALLGSAAGARSGGGAGRRQREHACVCVSSVWRACVCVETAGLSPGTTLFAECRIGFAECQIRGTRQRHFKKQFICPLPSARSAGTRQSLGSPSAWHSANKFLPIQF